MRHIFQDETDLFTKIFETETCFDQNILDLYQYSQKMEKSRYEMSHSGSINMPKLKTKTEITSVFPTSLFHRWEWSALVLAHAADLHGRDVPMQIIQVTPLQFSGFFNP